MRPKNKKTGFTIIEILTVLGIIVILTTILVPALSAAKRFSKVVSQKGQFHELAKGLEAFSHDYDGYPESTDDSLTDNSIPAYCGAMKLCEAMVGKDNLGFHNDSQFLADHTAVPMPLYFDTFLTLPYTAAQLENLQSRKPLYLEKNFRTCSVDQVWTTTTPFVSTFNDVQRCQILSDIFYNFKISTGQKVGMPVLYYKANPNGTTNALGLAATNYYNYDDNTNLVALGTPGGGEHPFNAVNQKFYDAIRNTDVGMIDVPNNKDTYILISAGRDSLYGTEDDIYNFGR